MDDHNQIEHNGVLSQSLNGFRKDRTMCDVTIVVGEEEFPAHRLILSAASNYYKTMFNVEMKENVTGKVEMHDISVATFKSCIEYIYTGFINIHADNVYDLLRASSLQQILDLQNLCMNFIKQNITIGNCLESFKIAKIYNNDELQGLITNFITENFEEVAINQDFNQIMDAASLGAISASENAKVTNEELVYEILLSWIKHDLEKREKYFVELFSKLRLTLLSPDFLFDVVSEEELVRNNKNCLGLVQKAIRQVSTGQATDVERVGAMDQGTEILIISKNIKASDQRPIATYYPNRLNHPEYEQPAKKTIYGCAVLNKKLYIVCEGRDLYIMDKSKKWSFVEGDNTEYTDFSVAAHEGSLYLAGGSDDAYDELDTVARFSPSTLQWEDVQPMNKSRYGFAMHSVGDSLYAIDTDSEKYSSNQWTYISEWLGNSMGASAVKGDRIYVTGTVYRGNKYVPALFIYLTTENLWAIINDYVFPPNISGMCSLNDDLYIVSCEKDKSSISLLIPPRKNFTIQMQKFIDWSRVFMVTF